MLSCTKLLRRCLSSAASSSPQPWLFVGLGNPGEKYQYTRHNVGFDMIDAFGESQGIQMSSVHCKALFGEGLVVGTPVLLAKPQTYMNLSGESVKMWTDDSSGIQPQIGQTCVTIMILTRFIDLASTGAVQPNTGKRFIQKPVNAIPAFEAWQWRRPSANR